MKKLIANVLFYLYYFILPLFGVYSIGRLIYWIVPENLTFMDVMYGGLITASFIVGLLFFVLISIFIEDIYKRTIDWVDRNRK